MLFGFKRSFLILERKSSSSGYLDTGGLQIFLPGTCRRWHGILGHSSDSSDFSRKNTAVCRRASNTSKSSWTCCQFRSFGVGQKEGPLLNTLIWCSMMFASERLMGLRCWAIVSKAALNSFCRLRKRYCFLQSLLILW